MAANAQSEMYTWLEPLGLQMLAADMMKLIDGVNELPELTEADLKHIGIDVTTAAAIIKKAKTEKHYLLKRSPCHSAAAGYSASGTVSAYQPGHMQPGSQSPHHMQPGSQSPHHMQPGSQSPHHAQGHMQSLSPAKNAQINSMAGMPINPVHAGVHHQQGLPVSSPAKAGAKKGAAKGKKGKKAATPTQRPASPARQMTAASPHHAGSMPGSPVPHGQHNLDPYTALLDLPTYGAQGSPAAPRGHQMTNTQARIGGSCPASPMGTSSVDWCQPREGMLEKKAQNKSIFGIAVEGSWQRRWFSLKRGELAYFSDDRKTLKKKYRNFKCLHQVASTLPTDPKIALLSNECATTTHPHQAAPAAAPRTAASRAARAQNERLVADHVLVG